MSCITVTTYFSLLDAVRSTLPPRALAGSYPSSIFTVGIDHSSFSSPPRISPQNEISRQSTDHAMQFWTYHKRHPRRPGIDTLVIFLCDRAFFQSIIVRKYDTYLSRKLNNQHMQLFSSGIHFHCSLSLKIPPKLINTVATVLMGFSKSLLHIQLPVYFHD